jgi:Lamin Tail Domain
MRRSKSVLRSLLVLLLLAGLMGVALAPMFANVRAAPQNAVNSSVTCPAATPTPTTVPAATTVPSATPDTTPAPPPTPTATPLTSVPSLTVLINEVGWMGTAACYTDKWIELWNPGSISIDLTGWTLTGAPGTIGPGTSGALSLSGTIPANGYYMIAQNPDVFQPAFSFVLIDPNLNLSFFGEALYLVSPFPNVVDTANINGLRWPAGSSFPNYQSMERRGVVPDVPSAWITYDGPTGPTSTNVKDGNGNYIHGTPGAQNWAFGLMITPSPVPTATRRIKTPTPFPPTPFAHVVLNEFLPRAGYDWNGDGVVNINDEFIEIENLGPISVNLSGWKLDTVLDSSSPFYLPSRTLNSGQRAVFFGSTTGLLLQDSGDTVRLINRFGIIVDARSYGPVLNPDQTHCRIPDGIGYWRFPCFPTPGNANALTGSAPAPPPIAAAEPTPCLLADTVPDPFVQAVCQAFGADTWNRKYWDDLAQQNEYPVPDPHSKWQTSIQ